MRPPLPRYWLARLAMRFLIGLALPTACAAAAAAATAATAEKPGDAAVTAVTDLPFSAFFRYPVVRGLEPTPTLLALNGRKVRITGYMVASEAPRAGSFLLTPLPVRLSEHADGEATDLPANTVLVLMPANDRTRQLAYVPGPLQLTGTLQWGRAEQPDGSVSWLRLLLDPRS